MPNPLGLSHEEARHAFPDSFFDELDSGFSADIACCDSCHDDFVALWPHAPSAEDHAFERSLVSVELVYENSRLSELFTKEEFQEFSAELVCPRCASPLGPNIWVFNFPFNVEADFEEKVRELANVARSTPFLILTHPFAQEVFSSLKRLSPTIPPTPLPRPLYRARSASSAFPLVIEEFGPPPPHLCGEGRYNHAGHPVLYLASDLETCVEEMRGSQCVIAELDIDASLNVLDLVKPEDSHPEFYDSLSALTYSALMSAKQPQHGWHKPAYVFSRFIADCSRHLGIQAIRYPSTRITKRNFNIVIIDPTFNLGAVATMRQVVPSPAVDRPPS
jgi:RES domain-containing protein